MREPFKKRIDDVVVEQAHGGSGSRRLLLSSLDSISGNIEAVTMGYLDPGGVFDWHSHQDIDEFFFVTQGDGTIKYENDSEFNYSKGDLIYSPQNLSHRLENTGDIVNEFIFIRITN